MRHGSVHDAGLVELHVRAVTQREHARRLTRGLPQGDWVVVIARVRVERSRAVERAEEVVSTRRWVGHERGAELTVHSLVIAPRTTTARADVAEHHHHRGRRTDRRDERTEVIGAALKSPCVRDDAVGCLTR